MHLTVCPSMIATLTPMRGRFWSLMPQASARWENMLLGEIY